MSKELGSQAVSSSLHACNIYNNWTGPMFFLHGAFHREEVSTEKLKVHLIDGVIWKFIVPLYRDLNQVIKIAKNDCVATFVV